ncbi:MAG: hypothetical protein MUC94_09180 [bacterium]|nr:hypothetical protein [bacterium]
MTPYDAALILRHTVNQNAKFPIGKDWTFTLHDFKISDENWSLAPNSRTYAPLKTDRINQDYLGILYGDVSGNWGSEDFSLSGAQTQISITALEQQSDGKFLLPVSIKFYDAAYSGLLKMQFNHQNLKFVSCGKDSQSNDTAILEASASSELIHVAFAASEPFNDDELVIKFLFEKIGSDDISASNFNILEMITKLPQSI